MTRHIASFGIGGTIPRVHVYDSFARHIFEAGECGDGQWYSGELIGVTGAPRPSADYYDAIASFAVGGQTSRIYYFDEDEISRDRQVVELGWGDDHRWYAAKVGLQAQAPPARQGSDNRETRLPDDRGASGSPGRKCASGPRISRLPKGNPSIGRL